MRPGQNKRMRGRNNNNNNNRKGPNPLTRSYESNGPDVKIRGTAHHIGEKYLQLARDAQSSGDPVMAESYLQHAEHYFRLIASAQLAQQQAAYGYQRPPGEQQEQDDDGDEDFESLPDRFASPSEQRAAQQQPAPQPYQDRPPYQNGNNGQPYEARQQNYDRQNQPQPHYDRPQHQGYNQDQRSQQGGQDQRGPDNQSRGERNYENQPRQERSYDNRNRGNGHQDRNGQDRNGQDRNAQDRNAQDRNGQDRGQGYQGGQQQDRQPRDYDNRNFRNNRDRGPRDFRDNPQAREQRVSPADEQPSVGLPAFITGPTRSLPDASAHEPEHETQASERDATPETGDETPHLRPRRRRRPKADFAAGEGEAQPQVEETSSGD